MHFQVYIPNAPPGANPQILADAGLADLAGDAAFVDQAIPERVSGVGQCPPSGRGALITWPSSGGVLKHGYRPDEQTWWPSLDRVEDQPRYYVGIWNDSRPTPADLARRPQFGGHPVRLLDGHEWLTPAAVRLPTVLADGLDGHPVWRLRDQFVPFWRDSRQMYLDLIVHGSITDGQYECVVNADWRDYAARALNLNFRFPRELLTRLALCGEDELFQLCLATIEGQSIREFELGKDSGPPTAASSADPGSSSSSPGAPDA